MKPLKIFYWLARVLLLLAWAAGATTVHATAPPPDPLVGDWLYWHDHPVAFNADGTATWKGTGGFQGTWEYMHNPEVQRHYHIVWKQGLSIDNLVLAEDGQRAHVANQVGSHVQYEQYDVRRAVSDKPPTAANPFGASASPASAAALVNPHDPLVGKWVWSNRHPAAFHADGTAQVGGLQGTWQYLSSPGPDRKYRMDWGHGKYLETFVCAPDFQSGTIMKDGEPSVEAHRAHVDNPAFVPAAPGATAPSAIAAAPSITAAVTPSVAVGTTAVAAGGPADPGDPILGNWEWSDRGLTTFKADGKAISSQGRHGLWQYLHNPGTTRQYLVTWGPKGYTDALTFTPGATSAHVVHVSERGGAGELGAQYDITRGAAGGPVAPVAPAPTVNPFGTSSR